MCNMAPRHDHRNYEPAMAAHHWSATATQEEQVDETWGGEMVMGELRVPGAMLEFPFRINGCDNGTKDPLLLVQAEG